MLQTLCYAALASAALAWDKFDHELFDLHAELQKFNGNTTSFYSLFNLTKSATEKEIIRQYRKLSQVLHPDKNRNDPKAHEAYARVNKVYSVLKDKVKRARYDHFHDNGFPKWRGTGWYYSRWRPGFFTVVILLIILSLIIQYIIKKLSHYLESRKIKSIRERALRQAWGDSLSGSGRRKIKLSLSAPSTDYVGGDVATVSHSSRVIPAVVENTDVYIVDEDTGDELILDESSIPAPQFTDTWVFNLAKKVLPAKSENDQDDIIVESEDIVVESPVPVSTEAKASSSATDSSSKTSKTKKRKGKKN